MTSIGRATVGDLVFRVAGGFVVALTLVPAYRLLDRPQAGSMGAGVIETAREQIEHLWAGSLLLAGVVLFVSLLAPERFVRRLVEGAAALLDRGTERAWLVGAGVAAGTAVLLLNLRVFEGRPNLIDATAQLLHARYLASGRLAGPGSGGGVGGAADGLRNGTGTGAESLGELGFWYFPNTLLTPEGWVSHFPPGHALAIAPGVAIGLPWLTPVVLSGITASLTLLLTRRLVPDDTRLARAAGVLGGLTPLLLLQASTYMNHATAAFLGVATLLLALRARDGHAAWSLLTGAGVTALLAVRPLAAVAICLTVVLLVWLPAVGRDTGPASRGRPLGERMGRRVDEQVRRGFRERVRSWLGNGGAGGWLGRRCGAAFLGGLPFLLLHGVYNRAFFGHPLIFGYHRSFGESAGLGLGLDPWGNVYGAREALAYTSADLSALNMNLLEVPLPVVTLVGLALLLGMAADRGTRLAAGWALIPVGLGVSYWHHGHSMGPRMLAEFAPAWGILVALSLSFLLRRLPSSGRGAALRRAGGLLVLGALAGGLLLMPQRLARHGGDHMAAFRMAEPAAPAGSLVFVTDTWISRMNADLVSRGVPQIVMETAIRQNSTCLVEEHRQAYRRGQGAFAPYGGVGRGAGAAHPDPAHPDPAHPDPAPLDLEARPPPYGLERGEIGQGTAVAFRPREPVGPACVREMRADERGGSVEAGYLLWLGDLPGIEEGRIMYARDMGPEANERLLSRYPHREPFLLMRPARGAAPLLLPYREGVTRVWDGVGGLPPSQRR